MNTLYAINTILSTGKLKFGVVHFAQISGWEFVQIFCRIRLTKPEPCVIMENLARGGPSRATNYIILFFFCQGVKLHKIFI
jgi:hypothetical protein